MLIEFSSTILYFGSASLIFVALQPEENNEEQQRLANLKNCCKNEEQKTRRPKSKSRPWCCSLISRMAREEELGLNTHLNNAVFRTKLVNQT